MKKTIVVVICFLLLVSSGCSQQYKRISFDEGALGEKLSQHIDNNTEVIINATEVLPAQIPIYEISERKISDDEYQKTIERLGAPGTGPGQSIDLDGNELRMTWASVTDTDRGDFTMTDEELEKIAWDTFEKLPFMEGTFQYLGIVRRGEISDSEGKRLVRVVVSFRRLLDGVRVLGSEICHLGFDGSGLVELTVQLYQYKKIGKMDVIPVADAAKRIKNSDRLSLGNIDDLQNMGMVETMHVEEIRPLLINQFRDGCTILQPVYSFMGKAEDNKGTQTDFNAWVIAIPESYT